MRFLRHLYYSFPFQLVLLHLKKHHILLGAWVLLLLFVTGTSGKKLGIPYLFLDPEYLGKVNFLSFLIVGFASGGFIITWNITSYILNCYRFPFLATLGKPFNKFCLNNFAVPSFFVLVYCLSIIRFQTESELQTFQSVALQVGGFLTGLAIFLFLTFTYFFQTNKDMYRIMGIPVPDGGEAGTEETPGMRRASLWGESPQASKKWDVRTYLANPRRIRLVRTTEHYDEQLMQAVFKQNHLNALILESIALLTVVALGFLIDYPAFRIPAGASIFLLFSILIMLAGAFAFWVRGWRTTLFILIIMAINLMMEFDLFSYRNRAYGLDYGKPPVLYNYDRLMELSNDGNIRDDKKAFTGILENWGKKQMKQTGRRLPKIIFLNVSGGGLRSAVLTMDVLRKADSILQGRLFEQTFLITGASGGMMGASYFRELCLRRKTGENISPHDRIYVDHISRDLLNAVSFMITVNDLFYPFHSFTVGEKKYKVDRGYALERQLNENTGFMLDKPIGAYEIPERKMLIPVMVFSPVIINDARNLYISAQPVSFLTRNPEVSPEPNGAEFMRLFQDHDARELLYTTALRMSATFPYISPNVFLPTNPALEVMDAGMRDNYGMETAIRFIFTFREWIRKNTGGVIILQIRDTPKLIESKEPSMKSALERLVNPIGNLYVNWQEFQDFYHDNLAESAKAWLGADLDIVSFQYLTKNPRMRAALSWHLTTREKKDVTDAFGHEANQRQMEILKKLMNK